MRLPFYLVELELANEYVTKFYDKYTVRNFLKEVDGSLRISPSVLTPKENR